MLESKSKEISGSNYTVYPLKATKGLTMFVKLTKIVGPALGIVIDAAAGGKDGKINFAQLMSTKVNSDIFGRASEALVIRLDEGQIQAMVAELAEVTEISSGGKTMQLKSVYEAHFAGKMGMLFAWLKFALEVQFADFFASWGTSDQDASSTPSEVTAAL